MTITLPCYGIKIELSDKIDGQRGGSISSELHEDDCPSEYLDEMKGIERLILALACQGFYVEAPAFIRAVETAVEASANEHF